MTNFHDYLRTENNAVFGLAGIEHLTHSRTYHLPYYKQYVTALCQYSPFSLEGADTHIYLQGQLCGDIDKLTPQQALYTAHCTPKGRVYSTLLLLQYAGKTIALAPNPGCEDFAGRLKKYILFSKVSLTPINSPLHVLEFAGPDSLEAIKALELEQVISLPGATPRFLAVTDCDAQAIAWWQSLSTTHCPISTTDYAATQIQQGVAEVAEPLREAFLPQMLGFDKIGAMSLKKGCYVGQEVIARTHNLGQLKRHLYRATIAGAVGISSGEKVMDQAGNALGMVTNSYIDRAEGITQLLAVIADRGLKSPVFCQATELCDIELAHA